MRDLEGFVMSISRMVVSTFLLLVTSVLLGGCSLTPSKKCSEGRTDVDGICVSYEQADFISCANSQSIELGKEIKNSFKASAGHLGTKVDAEKQVIEEVYKKYTATDDIKKVVIEKCLEFARLLNDKSSENLTKKSEAKPKQKKSDLTTPIQKVYVGQYSVDLYGCRQFDDSIKCFFTVMKEEGGNVFIHRASKRGTSTIYYDNGESKVAHKVRIANSETIRSGVKFRLPPKIPIKSYVEFRGVKTVSLQLLEIGVNINEYRKAQYARFENIKL